MNIADVAASNNLRVLRLLLAVPGNVSQEDLDLALLACLKQNESLLEALEALLQAGASPQSEDRAGNFPLKIAAEKGFPEILQLLVKEGAYLEHGRNQRGTALHYAVLADQGESVKTIIKLGANVNSRDRSGCTPLIFCAQTNRFQLMRELIEAGCDLNLADERGWTALHYACHKARGVELLLKAGANPDVKDKDNNAPIHMASTEGFDNVVIKLVEHGCDVNAENTFQRTALHYLAMKNHWRAIEAIADVRGDLAISDNEGKTPLCYAVQRNRPEAVKALLRANCKLEQSTKQNIESENALKLALERKLYGISKLLVLAGAPLHPIYIWMRAVETERDERRREREENSARIFLDSDEEEEEESEEEGEDEEEEAMEWFSEWLHRPHTLQQLCRLAIRHFIGPGMLVKQDLLPVPSAIRDYITLKEVEDQHVEGFLI